MNPHRTAALLVLLGAAACRPASPADDPTALLDDMEDLAVELVQVSRNSWCEPGARERWCELDADGDHTITGIHQAMWEQGEYDLIIDGVPFGGSDLRGVGTVIYDQRADHVQFIGMVSINDSDVYDVEIAVTEWSWKHYEVDGHANGEDFSFDLRRRTAESEGGYGDECRAVELGVDCE